MTTTTKDEYLVRVLMTDKVREFTQISKANGFTVEETEETVKITDHETMVFSALLKTACVWICRLNKRYFFED